jgi:hypothetical protein
MNERKYRHPDGIGRKRSISTREYMTTDDLLMWFVTEVPADAYEVLVSPGVYVTWYSHPTEAEAAKEAAALAEQEEHKEKWERETYARLHEKYGNE